MDHHLPALAIAPLAEQQKALAGIVLADPDLSAIVDLVAEQDLPDGWLVAGAIYQTAWNLIAGQPRRTGIKDYDVIYFDPDTSYEAEDRVIRRMDAACRPLGLAVEVRNQARVHLWYEVRFGFPIPPLTSSAESLLFYASTTQAVGVRRNAAGGLDMLAPYGLSDIFAMHLRPNRLRPNGPSHDAKARRCLATWPTLTVEWW